jgi:hypothetical protein
MGSSNNNHLHKKSIPPAPKLKGGTTKDNLEWLDWAADRAHEILVEGLKRMDNDKFFPKVVIADVTHTLTDDTYYVSSIASKHSTKYVSHSIEETKKLLAKDKWSYSGQVWRSDYSVVDMWSREDELIAIWEDK